MAKRFSKMYGNKGRAFNKLQSESYVKMPVSIYLMLHPYITASRTILNILHLKLNLKLNSCVGP